MFHNVRIWGISLTLMICVNENVDKPDFTVPSDTMRWFLLIFITATIEQNTVSTLFIDVGSMLKWSLYKYVIQPSQQDERRQGIGCLNTFGELCVFVVPHFLGTETTVIIIRHSIC